MKQNYTILDDVKGRIRQFILIDDDSALTQKIIEELIEKSSEYDKQIVVITKDIERAKQRYQTNKRLDTLQFISEEADYDNPLNNNFVKLVNCPIQLCRWIQDPFLIFKGIHKGLNELKLVQFKGVSRNIKLHNVISRYCDKDIHCTDENNLILHGGNIITSDKNVFIGMNHIISTRNYLNKDSNENYDLDDVISLYKEKYFSDKNIIPVGLNTLGIPSLHIDNIITPLGKINGRETILVAFPEFQYAEKSSEKKKLYQEYDAIAKELSSQGFNIIRNPKWILNNEKHQTMHNNAIVEQDPWSEIKNVWLPFFGTSENKILSKLDEITLDLISSLGFNTIPINGFNNFLSSGGALRCMVKSIR